MLETSSEKANRISALIGRISIKLSDERYDPNDHIALLHSELLGKGVIVQVDENKRCMIIWVPKQRNIPISLQFAASIIYEYDVLTKTAKIKKITTGDVGQTFDYSKLGRNVNIKA